MNADIFGILLHVRIAAPSHFLAGTLLVLAGSFLPWPRQVPPAAPPPIQTPGPGPSAVPTPQALTAAARSALSVIVLDPAHGGTDPGARGGAGLRESEVVVTLASDLKTALEKQGFQVVLTRQANDNPSFDDRSALANAQRGAAFITLHVGSTGLLGTVRVYTCPDAPDTVAVPGGFLPWDRAQANFLPLSRKLADLAQSELARQFKGSPNAALTAAVRQLRTIAAPAIAVELSSVSVEDRGPLDNMLPGVADAVARAVVAFKPAYDSAPLPGGAG